MTTEAGLLSGRAKTSTGVPGPIALGAVADPARGSRRARAALPVYALLAGFLLLVAAMGEVGLSVARMVFVAGCMGIGFRAYRVGGLALHVEIVIPMFVFGPLLRRIIDLHVGYDASGTMLIGPLAALVMAFPELRRLLATQGRPLSIFTPFVLMIACVVYGWALSSFAGNLFESSVAAIKYTVPLLYCMCLMLRPDQSEAVLRSAARAFLVVSPVIGLYGVWQHLNPQAWDRYWMVASRIPSIGQPFPNQVRVFSTMNSPASFAAYATCGLLLFGFAPRLFIPPILVPVVAILPLCLAILLTGVRTAWISAAVSLVFCLLFGRTRNRAALLIVCLALGVAFALMFTSFGDVISDRMSTLNNGVSGDGSGQDRVGDYTHVFIEDSRYTIGTGLAPVEGDNEMAALDGQLLMSAVQMGTTVGVFYVIGIIWAGIQALVRIRRNDGPLNLVAGALIVGNLVVIPLTAIAIGEIGFLFWMLVGALTASNYQPAKTAHSARALRGAGSKPGPLLPS